LTVNNAKAIADIFAKARRTGRALQAFPLAQPATLAAAYAVQEHTIAGLSDPLAGWKVAAIKPELRDSLGASRLAGPIVRLIDARLADDRTVEIPVIEGGFAAVEAEFAFLIGSDLPMGSAHLSHAELADAVASLHVAAEIAGSPLATLSDLGPTAVIADHGNNVAIIIGDAVADWRSRPLDTLVSKTTVDGVIVGEGGAARLSDGPIGALAFLVEHLASRERFLKAGDWVSTGATTGVHRVAPGAFAELQFGDVGSLSIRIVKAETSL
jgi:2-keto-4-pentenoate hydratase